jgi:hypothetical protein
LNWPKYGPDYILVEELDFINKDLCEIQNSAIYRLLKARGYLALLKAKRSVIYGKATNAE